MGIGILSIETPSDERRGKVRGPVLILGATSTIAVALARELALKGHNLMLASRDEEECSRLAADLSIRFGIKACTGYFDANDANSHTPLLEKTLDELGGVEYVVVAVGDLGEDPATLDPKATKDLIDVNFTGLVSMIGRCALQLQKQGYGCILGIGSVAGDRGRQSNFTYGAAKGALALYLQGLRNRLHSHGIRVVTFKPGFVDTAMTYGKSGLFLVAAPETAGRALAKALEGRRDIIYFPWFWKWIMVMIRLLPESLFKRMKL